MAHPFDSEKWKDNEMRILFWKVQVYLLFNPILELYVWWIIVSIMEVKTNIQSIEQMG